jgi:hypothetical protein
VKTVLTHSAVAFALLTATFANQPARAADVYAQTTSARTQLSNLTGLNNAVLVTILNLPVGRWTVFGKVSAVNFGKYDIDRCALYDYGTIVDWSSTVTGQASNLPLVATMTLQAAITNTTAKSVGVWCYHDYAVSNEYLDPSASLIAMPAAGPIQQ